MEARELWQQVLFWEAEHHKTHCKLLKSLDRVKVLLQTEWEKEEKTKKKAEKKLRKAEKKQKQLRKAEEKRLEAEKKKAEQKQKQLRKAEEKRLAGEKKKAEQKQKKRLKVEKKTAERNSEAQRFEPCIYCAAPGITREHLVPKSVGGKCTFPCCLACNRNRGNKTPADYPPLYEYIRTTEGATHWEISMKAAKKNVKDAPRLKEKLEDWMKGIYTTPSP